MEEYPDQPRDLAARVSELSAIVGHLVDANQNMSAQLVELRKVLQQMAVSAQRTNLSFSWLAGLVAHQAGADRMKLEQILTGFSARLEAEGTGNAHLDAELRELVDEFRSKAELAFAGLNPAA